MAASRLDRLFCQHRIVHLQLTAPTPSLSRSRTLQSAWKHHNPHWKHFSSSARRCQQPNHRKASFSTRLRDALGRTSVQWRWIPTGMGIGFLGLFQAYRVQKRERHSRAEREDEIEDEEEDDETGKPRKRKRVRPSGPWSVQIMSTLPLKAMSRVWGRFNELTLPQWLRVPGFKLYSWVFGVNLSEVAEPDLRTYPNLASFFYRTLKPGVRPLDPDPNAILSPADGKVIQFGTIEHGEVEQVKGVTYNLEALLGAKSSSIKSRPSSPTPTSEPPSTPQAGQPVQGETKHIDKDEEFARINGIPYSIPNLFSGPVKSQSSPTDITTPSPSSGQTTPTDQSTSSRPSSESEVRADLALSEPQRPWWSPFSSTPSAPTTLYYIVVYLAPGDYHRFHSPVSWVVSARRHFAGELYSVSPYLVRTLPGLFTLNERVVLLGRWRHGFFSYTPVGATNVGSIIINFDRELRTNSLNTNTAADRAAEKAQRRGVPYSGFAEATYAGASEVLGGHALRRGEEMGGFQLGSTVVLVFEAPKGVRRSSFDEGFQGGDRKGGWRWCVERGQHVQMGQALGKVVEPE